MPKSEGASVELEDIEVRALAGELLRKWSPQRVTIEIKTRLQLDEEANGSVLNVAVEVTGNQERDGEEDESLTYTGSVSVLIVPADDFRLEDTPEHVEAILDSAWPVARSALIEHANRLGTRHLKLPLVLEKQDA